MDTVCQFIILFAAVIIYCSNHYYDVKKRKTTERPECLLTSSIPLSKDIPEPGVTGRGRGLRRSVRVLASLGYFVTRLPVSAII